MLYESTVCYMSSGKTGKLDPDVYERECEETQVLQTVISLSII